ncbi:JAB domain-containing protein [uncultured Paraglaciecola sp.]|uniref:JAB domain-containing protein n=1 Tax=uncultured Paraglaciecola sp. TaxID=1765024 RepID=UPI00262504C9|nr:JAB domain-containing protein [uncultured Paraglaciecola sp.]
MNVNTSRISRNLPRQDEGDPYEKIKTRPGTTEKQKETGESAYTELLESHARWAGGSLLGSAFAKDFKKQGGSRLLGRVVKSEDDLAVLAQVVRDPRFETFRVFFVKDEQIIHHTAVSSRLPGAVYLDKNTLEHFRRTHKQVEADGYWLLHNHPTGHSKPSDADIKLTIEIAKSIPGFKGHVVINSNEYSTIEKNGNVELISNMDGLAGGHSNKPYKDHDLLQMKITSTSELAHVGQLLKQKDEFFALIGINTTGFVHSISEMPLSILQQKDRVLHARLRNFARHSGINTVFAVTDADNLNHPQFIKAVESGVLSDVVMISGDGKAKNTLRTMGVSPNITNDAGAGLFGNTRTTIKDDGFKAKRGGRGR